MTQAAFLIRALICALLFWDSLFATEAPLPSPLFTPPKNWTEAPLSSSSVKISFFTKGAKEFCPSVNLAEEKTSLSAERYLSAIKKMYMADPDNRWRSLGTIATKSGTAHLTSLDMEAPVGKVRILQSILIKEGVAYILTGAVLAEEFGLYQKELIESFRSLTFGE